jgi:ABC-type transporter Mla subunit MlaD
MSEVTDIVVPILQRLQTDVGDLKRNSDKLEALVEAMADRLDKIESYVTYSLGLISQNKADLDRQGRSLLEVARRVETLEQKT